MLGASELELLGASASVRIAELLGHLVPLLGALALEVVELASGSALSNLEVGIGECNST